MRRVMWRLLPFLMLCYFIAYVDRVNAGFAALTMNRDVGLTQAIFGIGGGLFFYCCLCAVRGAEQPCHGKGRRPALDRAHYDHLGAGRRRNSFHRWTLHVLFEPLSSRRGRSWLFSGVILYLTYWFPSRYRARVVATFMVAIPVSSFLGSPLSAALLELEGVGGLHGWQWLFIIEALPAILLGLTAFFVLPSRPAEAKWLTREQSEWLQGRLEYESRSRSTAVGHLSLWKVLANPYIWALALIYAGSSATSNALSLWQPQILKSFGLTNLQTGLLNMIPFGIASVFMILWGMRADKIWRALFQYRFAACSDLTLPLEHQPYVVADGHSDAVDLGFDRQLRDQGSILGFVDGDTFARDGRERNSGD